MNPRPKLELNPNMDALQKSQVMVAKHLSSNNPLGVRDSEPWRYVKNVCEFFVNKERRTWNVSQMLSKAIIAARFERHSKDNGGIYGFHSKLTGDDLYVLQRIIRPASKYGYDYKYTGDYEDRPGLQSEFIDEKYIGACTQPRSTYATEGVDSLLVKFMLPNNCKEVERYTHRSHILRVNYGDPYNIHVLYHKVISSRFPGNKEVLQLLSDFKEQYLEVRYKEGLIKVVFLMYTQFECRYNSKIIPKSVFVINPLGRNADHVRVAGIEIKGQHGKMSSELAEAYKYKVIPMFDSRMSVGPVRGRDGKLYLGYRKTEEKSITKEEVSDVKTPVEDTKIEYSNEIEDTIVSIIDDIRTSVKALKEKIEKSTESLNFGKVGKLSLEAQNLQFQESNLLKARDNLYAEIRNAKECVNRAKST